MLGTFSVNDLVTGLSPHDRAELRRAWYDTPPVWSMAQSGQDPDDMADWLGSLRPDDWHEIVVRFDWDSGDIAIIAWIAGQPDADRATILTILLEQDVQCFNDRCRMRPNEEPRSPIPGSALVLDLISQGFAAGHYRDARFCLNHSDAVLPRTRDYLADQPHANPSWAIPDRAWEPCDGVAHRPDFLWDHIGNCQRLHFEDWLQGRLRPN